MGCTSSGPETRRVGPYARPLDGGVNGAAFSAGGEDLATAGGDGAVRSWTTAPGGPSRGSWGTTDR